MVQTPHELTELGQRPGTLAYGRALWERREFVLALPQGELKAQNMDTVLGGLWHLLNPLLLAGVYYLVFGLILRIGDRGTDNFVAFLTVGLFVFFYTRKSIQAGARTIISNRGLISSIKFPRAVLPIAAVVGETMALGPAIMTMAVIVLLTGESLHLTWLLILPAFALQLLFNLGLVFGVARLTDHFRDVAQLMPYLLSIWLYLSGVFYSADAFLSGRMLFLFQLNPMYAFIEIVRDALMHGEVEPTLWLIATGWTAVVLPAGFFFFRQREEQYGRA
jgi:teichoic acid transport system permease protein